MTGSIVTKFAPVMLQVRFNAELREERQKLFSERDSRRADLKNLEEKRKELEVFEQWAREKRHLLNFIATTKSKSPAVYYLPRVLNERAEKLRKENAERVEAQITARRAEIEKDISELLARVSLPPGEQQAADNKPPTSRRSVKSRLSTVSVSDKDTGDLMSEPVRLEDPLALVHFVDADPIADTESPPPPAETNPMAPPPDATVSSQTTTTSAAVPPAEEKLEAVPASETPATSAADVPAAAASATTDAADSALDVAHATEEISADTERPAEGSPDSRAYAPDSELRGPSQSHSPNSDTMRSVL